MAPTKTISILCMFIRLYDVTYIEIQFNYLKLRNFISSWEMVKTTIKLCKRFFFHKIKKNMQRKPRMKYFIHLQVWCHSLWIQNSARTDQNTTKWVQVCFSIKSRKLCHKNRGDFFGFRFPLNKQNYYYYYYHCDYYHCYIF